VESRRPVMAGLVSRGRRPSSYPKTTSLISCCAQPETEVEARADTTHRRAGRSPIVVSRQSHYGRPAVLSDSDAHPRRSRCVRSPFSASSSLVLVPARPPVLLSHASSRRTQISPYRPTRPRGGSSAVSCGSHTTRGGGTSSWVSERCCRTPRGDCEHQCGSGRL
jgi:hypothetical protein